MDPKHLLETFGTAGLCFIIFAESGLLFGFFLPGDSLLFTAGILCTSESDVHLAGGIFVVLIGCFVAAVLGAQAGYLIGRRAGPALFRRPDSRLFKHEHLERTQKYFDEHGSRTIVIARFVPIVRTFATVVAGIGRMDPKRFLLFNIIGALLWSVGVTLLGYALGSTIPNIDRYLLPIVAGIIVVSAIPPARELLKARRARRPN